MSSVATAQPSALKVDAAMTAPVGPAQVPATVEQPAAPRVPLSKRVKDRFDAFTSTPFGEGLSIWMNKVGSVAGYVVPAAVAASAGYAIGSGDMQSTAVGAAVAWGLGGLAATAIANAGLDNVKQYEKEKHPYPRLRAFGDVMGYFILPAATAGWVAAEYLTGAQGALFLGPAIGAVTASVGIQVLSVRKGRTRGY